MGRIYGTWREATRRRGVIQDQDGGNDCRQEVGTLNIKALPGVGDTEDAVGNTDPEPELKCRLRRARRGERREKEEKEGRKKEENSDETNKNKED